MEKIELTLTSSEDWGTERITAELGGMERSLIMEILDRLVLLRLCGDWEDENIIIEKIKSTLGRCGKLLGNYYSTHKDAPLMDIRAYRREHIEKGEVVYVSEARIPEHIREC